MTDLAIYARKSPSDTDEQLGVDTQVALCRKAIQDRYPDTPPASVQVFTDVAKSAFEAKYRPAYEALLQAIRGGTVRSIFIRHNDRLHRDVSEYQTFTRLIRKHNVQVHAVLGGDWSVDSASGRLSGTMLAAFAEYESALRKERVVQGIERRARQGLPAHTKARCLGFLPDNITHHPEEAPALREAASALLTGQKSLSQVAREFGRQPTALKKALSHPRMIGYREHQGTLYPAKWQPILDRGAWEALRAMFASRSRPPAPRRHLLSGIARCGAPGCSALMGVTRESRSGEPVYRCREGFHVVRRASKLEAYVVDVLLDTLATRGRKPEAQPTEDRLALDLEVQALEARAADLEEKMANPDFPLDAATRALAAVREKLAPLRAELAAKTSQAATAPPESASALWGQSRKGWDSWWNDPERTLPERRALLSSVLASIIVYPTEKGRLPLNPEDVELVERDTPTGV